MTKHIDYDKFLEWLDEQINICRAVLDDTVSKGRYHEAVEYKNEIGTYEFLKNITQSDDWIERASFVEEEEWKKNINCDRFLEWLDEHIDRCQILCNEVTSTIGSRHAGRFYRAVKWEGEIDAYEYIKTVIQSNDWDERASFVEEDKLVDDKE